MGVTQKNWTVLGAAVAAQLAQETCTKKVRKKLAVMHVTKIVRFDWYGVCLKVFGTRNRVCRILFSASFLLKFLERLSVL